jgi:response regulator RpfG family c-di-GMP phosphodiesterase/serine/threonine protein kinase
MHLPPHSRPLIPPPPAIHPSLLPESASRFLEDLVRRGLLDAGDREPFLGERADRLREYTTDQRLGRALIQAGLLTLYQLERVLGGASHGLVLGNYRVLEELGKGGMGVVYLAEHRLMKRRVAIKVLPIDDDCHPALRHRFFSEMRVLAELSHPNVVLALDAGEVPAEAESPPLLYLVTELVEGGDLERHVIKNGLCGVAQACGYIRQAAAGLQAAHDRHLVHRDLKPSNLLLGPAGQVKLVDFGLARQFSSRLTDPRALVGSVEFMPPEQSHDPSLVGKEADVYGLGATLFWLLAGEGPYPYVEHVGQALRLLQQDAPRRLRSLRADVPEELDALVGQMLSRNPAHRPASPLGVMNALRPFLRNGADAPPGRAGMPSISRPGEADSLPRVLIVVDEASTSRGLHRDLLEQAGCECFEAAGLPDALTQARRTAFDLVLLDLAGAEADESCPLLRSCGDNPTLKVIAVSPRDHDGPAEGSPCGPDDCLGKPFGPRQLLAKVRRALERKAEQDRSARLAEQLAQLSRQLEGNRRARDADLREAHNALLFTLARIAESHDGETAGHLKRMQAYSRALAVEAARSAPWRGLVDGRFLEQLERCVPLHDIGKIGLPDDILLKPASLSPSERATVQTHPLLGDRLLESLGKEHGAALDFLGMARVIVRSHHERWDGKGYPDKLAGEAIPPAARLVAVADVYDALRRMRLYKPAMSHASAVRLMTERSEGQFDPTLVQALAHCHPEFDRTYREIEE